MRSQLGGVSATSALAILLLLGLVLRLAIAYVFYPGSGFGSDVGTFTSWALTLAEGGPGQFYESTSFADYPPGYLYVLWLVGGLAHLLAPLADGGAGAVAGALIKLPPMLADIGVGLALFWIVRRWAGERADAERVGLAAAAIYVFNPVTWYDSALWGQTDAVGALLVLLTVGALVRGNSEGAAALTVLAALVKPQFGIVLVPLAAGVLLHRHVLRPGTGPAHRPIVPARLGALRDWFEQERGWWRLISSATVALFVLLVMLVPFNLDIFGFIELMAGTAGGYPWLSVNAYNPWALIASEGRAPLAHGGGWSPDEVPLLGPLPGVVIGAGLLLAGFVLVWLRTMWRPDRRTIVIAAVVLALAFFVLPTRVHERYMFPIFGLLPLLAVVDRRWLWATVALSAAAFINLHGILMTPQYATPNIANLPLGEVFRQPPAIYASVILHTAGFAFACWALLPRFAHRPDPWQARAAAPALAHPAATDTVAPAGGVAVTGPFASGMPGGRREAAGHPTSRLGRLLAVVPLRRDRSAELVTERGGWLDRLDLLAVLLVFLATLGLRTFNLAQPYGMHFDEVYHARTGVEFLQHWRYGMPHSIYEYTHPHLAKYAMAVGIDTLGNNRVVSTIELGTAVRSAVIERRWDEDGSERRGDRVYLITDSGVKVLDLATRREVTSLSVFEGVALDDGDHTLYLADSAGGLWQLTTSSLDGLRADADGPQQVTPQQIGRLSLPGRPLELFAANGRLIVLAEGDTLVSVDPVSGAELARATVPGASSVVPVSADDAEALAVGAREGIVLLDAEDLAVINSFPAAAPVTGMAYVDQGSDRPTLYAAAGNTVQLLRLPGGEEPQLGDRLTMPGPVRDVYANPSAAMVHVLGMTPDGASDTLYVIEPHSNAVFADAVLPFAPASVVMDVQPRRPADDRLDALAFSSTGQLATVDIGGNTFAWRFPGVVAGALIAVAMYLLARFLFRRRAVAVFAALLVLVDGMAFANARIAMNDTYVALFITAAFALFAPLYVGRWRSPPVIAVGIVGVAVLLGLALASKWVGAYALGGVVLLILLRSALGRFVALAAMIGMTAVLGYIAIAPGPEATQLNYLFLALMVVLTTALAVAMAIRPLPLTTDERRLLVVGPAVLAVVALAGVLVLMLSGRPLEPGAMITPGRLLLGGAALAALAAVAALAFTGRGRAMVASLLTTLRWRSLAQRVGTTAEPAGAYPVDGEAVDVEQASVAADQGGASDPPPRGWLRPGSGLLGLPWLATLAVLAAVPLLVYTLSYVPWIELGNRWTADFPAGQTGQTFLDLQKSMYDYHNNLRATHAASSPWWAWPLDLKPVWFYQRDFAGATTGSIYNTGNMVLFWLSIPAVGFAAFMAWRRRSLALTLLVLAVASLWLPWARIDRATFAYHVFTAMPFAFLCLAYLLAELWHGPSRRSWAFARLAGAGAILLAPLLWVLRLPLCAVARVDQVNENAEACQLGLGRSLALSELQGVGFAGLLAGAILLAWLLWRWRGHPPSTERNRREGWLTALGMLLLGGGMVVVLGGAFLPGPRTFQLPLGEVLPVLWLVAPLVLLALLAVPAYYVLRARDARRFVVGALILAVVWFLVWYPNISGLPVPTLLVQAYQVVLPTLNYSFQFGVNTDPPGGSVSPIGVLMLGTVVTMLVGAAVYAVRSWREVSVEAPLTPAEESG